MATSNLNKIKDKRKDQIMNAALTVVATKGYSDCRMDDIVSEAALSKGTIYWYYSSKKDVFLSLVNHWVNRWGVTLTILLKRIFLPLISLRHFLIFS